jgi:hypothetical protein
MFRRVCAVLAVIVAMPVWSQVEPSAAGGYTALDQDARMITPPLVSGATLPLDLELGQRSNYLSGGVTLNSAYIGNVQPGETSAAINDESYSIWPLVTLDQKGPRSSRTLTYSSGFTFYQRTHALDSINQSMDASADYQLGSRVAASLTDSLRQNSNVFNQPLITGGLTSQPAGVENSGPVIPFEEELKNDTSAIASYQFAKFAMIGAKVGLETLNFPNLSQGSGLYNSKAESVLGFYNRRISRAQYLGGTYQGANVVTSGKETTTQTQTVSFFYTFYSNRALTMSVAAGPQYLSFKEPGASSYQEWTPSVKGSFGWQNRRIRLGFDYAKDVTAGQGILGAYGSNSADASLRFQLTRNWIVNSTADYENDKNSVPTALQGFPGGHSVSGTASADYSVGEHMVAGLGYTLLHQNYSGIAEISGTPDSDRVFVSFSYYFRRPLGR